MTAQNSSERPELAGHCLCGRISIRAREARPDINVCHCDMCRRWGGMAFAGIWSEDFSVEGQSEVATFRSSEWAERSFCRHCGSSLWYRFLPEDRFVFLAGLFDLPETAGIDEQIFVDQKPGWYDILPAARQLSGKDAMKGVEGHAAQANRPDDTRS